MPDRQPCAGAIVHDGSGRLLLVRRGRAPSVGSWSIPGGRCQPGEDPREACVREVAEETGLSVDIVRFVGQVVRAAPDGGVYVIDDFLCRLVGGELVAGDDAADARWVGRKDLAGLELVPGLVDALSQWRLLPADGPDVRTAGPDDIIAICAFGEAHIRSHYAPLIGAAAADDQVRNWWSESAIGSAVASDLVVVAVAEDEVVGVGQRGRNGDDHVIYKLYVAPSHRGGGLGPRLIDALVAQLPQSADRLYIEHFAGNERATGFYEREGFRVARVEPSRSGNPALDVVWRVRGLRPAVTEGSSRHAV